MIGADDGRFTVRACIIMLHDVRFIYYSKAVGVVGRRHSVVRLRGNCAYTKYVVLTVSSRRARLQTWFGGEPGRGHGQGRPSSPELGVGEGLRARHIPGDVSARAQDQTVAEGDAVPARLGARIARVRHR